MTTTIPPESEAHTVASAWASSGLGLPAPEDADSPTVFAEQFDDERRARRGALTLFGASCLIAAAPTA